MTGTALRRVTTRRVVRDHEGMTETNHEGIRRSALAHRVWDGPFVSDEETFDLGGPVDKDAVRAAVTEGREETERRNRGRAT